jgi:H+-transporting ATPase
VEKGQIPPDAFEHIERASGFAQVFPAHKWAIVKVLQGRDEIVGMTGDGVNDAPALKQADVGIAVSGAVAAARAAAALILTAPGLSVIVRGIEEARRIFARMMSYTQYRIAMTIDIMVFVVLASLVYDFFPLTPIMIIALALLDDIPIMTIAFDNARVSARPVTWDMHRVLVLSSVLGVLAVVQIFGLLWTGDTVYHLSRDQLRTTMFLQLVAGGHLMLFLTRQTHAFFRRPWPNPKLTIAIVATQAFAVLMCAFGWLVPAISWKLIGAVWLYDLAWMVVLDVAKVSVHSLIERRTQRTRMLSALNQPLDAHAGLHHPTPHPA